MEIKTKETIAYEFDEACDTPHAVINGEQKWVVVNDMIKAINDKILAHDDGDCNYDALVELKELLEKDNLINKGVKRNG